jgi:ABC-type transporter Mla MlaB component
MVPWLSGVVLAALLTILPAPGALAGPLTRDALAEMFATHHGLLPDPSCDGSLPLPVEVHSVSARTLLHRYGTIAAATVFDEGRAIILLDGETLSRMPLRVQRFILAHECQHVRLDHGSVAKALGAMPSLLIDLERTADCAALAEMHRTRPVTSEMVQEIARYLAALSQLYGLPPLASALRTATLETCFRDIAVNGGP